MMCAVIGKIGTDDRDDTKTIRMPGPALFTEGFPTTFSGMAAYTEWAGTGVWNLMFQINENEQGGRVVHQDARLTFDFTMAKTYRLVLDLDEVSFAHAGAYTMNFFDLKSGEWLAGRGFWVVQGQGQTVWPRKAEYE